jgi:hypothetical protein
MVRHNFTSVHTPAHTFKLQGRARVADEAKSIAERAIREWQRMAEERRLVMQEHEQQLLKLSQVRVWVVGCMIGGGVSNLQAIQE